MQTKKLAYLIIYFLICASLLEGFIFSLFETEQWTWLKGIFIISLLLKIYISSTNTFQFKRKFDGSFLFPWKHNLNGCLRKLDYSTSPFGACVISECWALEYGSLPHFGAFFHSPPCFPELQKAYDALRCHLSSPTQLIDNECVGV